MGESIDFECVGCGAEDAIDSTSLNFIQSATGWEREKCFRCDDCLGDALEDVTIDLSVGTDHTRSKEFQEAREARREERKQGRLRQVKRRATVDVVDAFTDPEWEEEKTIIEMPSEAKEDLKDLEWELAHPKFHQGRRAWTVDLSALDRAVNHMEAQGWTVTVDEAVRERA